MSSWFYLFSKVKHVCFTQCLKNVQGLGLTACALGALAAVPVHAEIEFNKSAYLQTEPSQDITAQAALDFNQGWFLVQSNFRSRRGEALMLLDRADQQGHPYAKIALLYLQSKIAGKTFSYVEHQFSLVPVLVGEDPIGITLAARAISSATDFLSKTPQGVDRLIKALDRALAMDFVPAYYVKGRLLVMLGQEQEGLDLIATGASKGNALARHYMATAGLNGQIKLETQQIFEFLEDAVEDGDIASMQDLAYCYEEGIGVPQDRLQAKNLYRRSMLHGDAGSAIALARLLLSDESPNYVEAFNALNFAYNNNKPEAANALGFLYMEGLGVRQNKRLGIELMEEAADQGDLTAIENLIACYRDGNGVAQDQNKVRQYQEKLKMLYVSYGLAPDERSVRLR